MIQESNLDVHVEELAVQASCQRLKLAGLSARYHLSAPELLRILKLLETGLSSHSADSILEVPVSLWQAVVPQLLSLLISAQVCG